MVRRKTWIDFKKTGLLWFINTILHAFGWAIIVEMENKTIKDVYPARIKFRGFNEKSNTEGYQKLSKYMRDKGENLYEESMK